MIRSANACAVSIHVCVFCLVLRSPTAQHRHTPTICKRCCLVCESGQSYAKVNQWLGSTYTQTLPPPLPQSYYVLRSDDFRQLDLSTPALLTLHTSHTRYSQATCWLVTVSPGDPRVVELARRHNCEVQSSTYYSDYTLMMLAPRCLGS